MNCVAIIPARGGSKRIPRKNIREFCGKPMIAWPIRAALQSGCFDRIIVTTDDEEIARVSEEWGAEVPFARPPEISGDHIGTRPVVAHAIRWLQAHGKIPDFICSIYATAPFVTSSDLREGFEQLAESNHSFAFSVTTFDYPIQRALRITPDGGVGMVQPEHLRSRSQDLEEMYHDAGQFYWGRAEAFLGEESVFSAHAIPIVLPRYRVQDIDTPEDWRRAELLFRILELDG